MWDNPKSKCNTYDSQVHLDRISESTVKIPPIEFEWVYFQQITTTEYLYDTYRVRKDLSPPSPLPQPQLQTSQEIYTYSTEISSMSDSCA